MRILHIVFNETGKGSYWRAFHFGRELAVRGHDVTLMSTSPTRRLSVLERPLAGMSHVETPDLFSGPLRSGWDPWNTLRRILWLGGRGFDLIHAIEARPTVIYPALLQRLRQRAPLIMGWSDWFGRGGSVEERANPLIRGLLRGAETFHEERFRCMADATSAICTTLRDKALALGVPPESIRTIPDGCDPVMLDAPGPAEARAGVGLPAEAFVVGYVGTIFPGDAFLMARAFDLLKAGLPAARLVVAGYCPVDIRALTLHPGDVVQTGPLSQDRLLMFLAACDAFWLPLRDTNANRGRWPHKLNDYLAIGRPTVATAVGDVTALFAEEAVGLLSPDAPEPFAAATLALAGNPDLRARMGREAREVAARRFSWTNLTDRLEELHSVAQDRFSSRQRRGEPHAEERT